MTQNYTTFWKISTLTQSGKLETETRRDTTEGMEHYVETLKKYGYTQDKIVIDEYIRLSDDLVSKWRVGVSC